MNYVLAAQHIAFPLDLSWILLTLHQGWCPNEILTHVIWEQVSDNLACSTICV